MNGSDSIRTMKRTPDEERTESQTEDAGLASSSRAQRRFVLKWTDTRGDREERYFDQVTTSSRHGQTQPSRIAETTGLAAPPRTRSPRGWTLDQGSRQQEWDLLFGGTNPRSASPRPVPASTCEFGAHLNRAGRALNFNPVVGVAETGASDRTQRSYARTVLSNSARRRTTQLDFDLR